MTRWIRLRQLALITGDLEATLAPLMDVFGLAVGFRDPHIFDHFGLTNALLPVGEQFIEIVAVAKDGTQGERYLKRRGAGGYMVILQADPHAPFRARVDDLNVRVITERASEAYHFVQLHPRDTGGPMLEVDWHAGGDTPDNPWTHAAGTDWRQGVRTDRVSAIAAAEIQSADPEALSARWSAILDRPAARTEGAFRIDLDGSALSFVEARDGRGEGLGGMALKARDRQAVLAAAEARGVPRTGDALHLAGVRFTLV